VRPALEAAATVVAAWILWTALSAVIDEKMPPPEAPGDEDEVPGSASRLDTLLPLVRNTLLIGLAVVAVIVALATLGLDIGPLLAGLGVVGIAIGFGAQSLVREAEAAKLVVHVISNTATSFNPSYQPDAWSPNVFPAFGDVHPNRRGLRF
jgi:hypothetical protein